MKKVFLYLYPIKEYTEMFLLRNDKLYDEWKVKRPLPVLNSTINKRYREKGYEIVYALYPDKEIYGIELIEGDKIIYTDITFSEASAYDENGNIKNEYVPKYPSEKHLLEQIGKIEELVVGGYHAMDCVKRVAEYALKNGINALIDLDLTDYFFNVYKQKDYFKEEEYSPNRFKDYEISSNKYEKQEIKEELFNKTYSSKAYGFDIKQER
ncbi:MAG: hypothetical protein IJ223_00390 [Clostridia bacterium]|nr:hypothetical protein [Clostridia bacterium]